jgi:hypothetical protein
MALEKPAGRLVMVPPIAEALPAEVETALALYMEATLVSLDPLLALRAVLSAVQ